MAYLFGFTPSAETNSEMIQCVESIKNSDHTMLYVLRDKTCLDMHAELIDHALTDLVQLFPENDKKELMVKVVNFTKNTSNTLLKQLLGKQDNKQVIASIQYLASLQHTVHGQAKIAIPISDELGMQLQTLFQQIIENNPDVKTPRAELAEQLIQLSNACIDGFLEQFVRTLELGLIKRKASEIAGGALRKTLSIAINKLIPVLSRNELIVFSTHYQSFILNI